MPPVLVDTHAAVWYFSDAPRLSERAAIALDSAMSEKTFHIASVSVVELVYLIEKGRLPSVVLERLLAPDLITRIVPVSLDFATARLVERIPRDIVADMPDRIIAATALALGLPLVTRDAALRQLDIETIW